MLTKILAGVDGSPGSRDAASLAAAIGAATGAAVELVGVAHDPRMRLPSRGHHDTAAAEAAMTEVVTAIRDELAPSASVRVIADHAAARGLQHATEQDGASLLVVGSSDGAQAGSVLSGRVTRQTLRSAACPVLLAARGTGTAALRRIVVGFDGGGEARVALDTARDLARATGAELVVVAVVDDRLPVSHVPGGIVIDLADWERIVADDRAHMAAMLERLVAPEPGISTDLRVGDPTDELVTAAIDADLLVVGSRRWGRLSRVVLGSTAEDLMVLAPCSVLVVPRPDAEPGVSSP